MKKELEEWLFKVTVQMEEECSERDERIKRVDRRTFGRELDMLSLTRNHGPL